MSGFRASVLTLAAVAAIHAGAASAQTASELAASDLTGAWQGAIITPAGRSELTLTIDPEGKAVLDNPAMGMSAVPVEGPTITDGEVRFAVPSAGARFEGRLSDDRKTLTGSLVAGRLTVPLVLTHGPLPVA